MLFSLFILVCRFISITYSQLYSSSELFTNDITELRHNSKNLTKDQINAKITYDKVLPCLLSSWMYEYSPSTTFTYPLDAQQHYEEILNKTDPFRHVQIHEYANYQGPWIENIFIKEFIDKPLSYFNGFIPLFIQWIDSQILRGRHFDHIHYTLGQILRPDVIYLAISQGDVGLGKIGSAYPNIFVLSAGGYGHVPIPLVKGEIKFEPLKANWTQDIGFFGNTLQGSRPQILGIIKENSARCNTTYKEGRGPNWALEMANTKFNLAPRGYGRASFRFTESIQMGRIPVFLYDDIAWVPYRGTNISVETFGFIRGLTDNLHSLSNLPCELKLLSEKEYRDYNTKLISVRDHYTYPGIVKQIQKFIDDPFGVNGGELRCIKHPRTERCCDTV